MKDWRIGFYVHYHGMGHKRRTEAILNHLNVRASVVTSRLGDMEWNGPTLDEVFEIDCDIDNVSIQGQHHAEDVPALHYAPLWVDGISNRVAQYTEWLNKNRPSLMVVDVSAEISMLTRLCSVPQVVMRQHGDRRDPAHLNAYAAAHSLLAPFPQLLEDDLTPQWVADKTVYLDGFCACTQENDCVSFDRPTIVVMFGRGGVDNRDAELALAAESQSHYDWIVIGREAPLGSTLPKNLSYIGWTDRPMAYVRGAVLTVSAAGHNSVMELGRERAKFIAIAEDRPFLEQLRKVRILNREELAVGLEDWPDVSQWPTLLRQAEDLETARWNNIFRNDGAKQAAEHLETVAMWSERMRRAGTPNKMMSHSTEA
ncbi:glycosyl transferase family 28 protein [Stieleria sp. JC731]|uniref:glycosyl transferase family 28 protein n=1 Tax=Pirellulaceae TaxID=2691357 RepID=UPI001E59CA76|nr:glycosyl transferase family 28 protein [Stieleria sp. JC731]MCC9600452.1 glycosyl transferase family 28 protein [Stieleria sp. JC731]